MHQTRIEEKLIGLMPLPQTTSLIMSIAPIHLSIGVNRERLINLSVYYSTFSTKISPVVLLMSNLDWSGLSVSIPWPVRK